MRKPELTAAIAESTGLSKAKANEVLTAITDEITRAVSEGNTVQLIGFGSFETRRRNERVGKNPQTGAEMKIPASNYVAFKAGKALKDAVN